MRKELFGSKRLICRRILLGLGVLFLLTGSLRNRFPRGSATSRLPEDGIGKAIFIESPTAALDWI